MVVAKGDAVSPATASGTCTPRMAFRRLSRGCWCPAVAPTPATCCGHLSPQRCPATIATNYRFCKGAAERQQRHPQHRRLSAAKRKGMGPGCGLLQPHAHTHTRTCTRTRIPTPSMRYNRAGWGAPSASASTFEVGGWTGVHRQCHPQVVGDHGVRQRYLPHAWVAVVDNGAAGLTKVVVRVVDVAWHHEPDNRRSLCVRCLPPTPPLLALFFSAAVVVFMLFFMGVIVFCLFVQRRWGCRWHRGRRLEHGHARKREPGGCQPRRQPSPGGFGFNLGLNDTIVLHQQIDRLLDVVLGSRERDDSLRSAAPS